MEKITLTGEMETLLIPLFGKASEMREPHPFLKDPKATEILEQVDVAFSQYHIPPKTNRMMSLRARIMDDFTTRFLEEHADALVLHLGCGLDSRCERVAENRRLWIDLDFAEVIGLRKHFFTENDRYRMIGSSVTDFTWLEQLPEHGGPVLVLAEGLLMYLQEEQLKALFIELKNRLKHCTLVCDVFSKITAKRVRHHPSLKKVGVTQFWGIDDPREIEQWAAGITWQQSLYFTDRPIIRQQPFLTRMMYKLSDHISMAKNAHRILVYEIREAK